MAESQKDAALTAGSRKKVSSFDEDFGDDFFTSWKSTKVGKDTIDLDADTARPNEKKSFNFDKLDDFELGGGFDKISSFKVDMSDLDFSSPPKKADKPKEKCAKESGKQDLKQDKFSFTFDFNELDRFSLDSELLKGKNIASKCTDEDGPDNSINHDRDQDSRSNKAISTDAFQNAKTKRVADADSVGTSRPTNSTDPGRLDGSCPSTSNLVNHDLSCEAMIPAEKQQSLVDEENVDTNNIEVSREHSNGAGSKKPYAEKAEQHNFLRSLSGVGSEDEAPKLGKEFPLSDHLSAADSVKKQDSCMRSIDSSQSRNSSPVNSYNSRCVQEITKFKSLKINGDLPINQQKQAEVIVCSTVHRKLTQRQKDGGSASDTEFSQKNLDELETSKGKKNPGPVILSPSVLRHSEGVKPATVEETPTPAVQLKSLNNSTGNVSRPTSLLASKELCCTQNRKIESMHLCPLNEKRELKMVEQSDDLKLDKSTTKGRPINLGKEKIARNIDSSRLHFQLLSVLNQAVAHSREKGSTPNLISSTLSNRRSSVLPVERQKVSLNDDKRLDISSFTVSRLPKLNISTPKSPLHEEAKSSVLSEENLGLPTSTKFTVANPVISEKTALTMSSPLKRKFEKMKEDPVAENPIKRVTDSPTERRKALEVSPNFNRKIIPSPEACHSNVHTVHITLPSSDATGSMKNFEVPVLVENDENVEKAEACAKELDNICNMLKRKHEEAKELLVRAIVNNNALLMLNHPMHDEKIRAVQRFAASLKSKEF